MADEPTVWDRVRAWFHFETPATLLQAYRRASPSVAEVMDLAQARRLECAIDGLLPWTMPPAVQAELLCAWNAFALQTLGDAILDADYDAGPRTRGFVPPRSAQQAQAFYAEVEAWLTRAREARANSAFLLNVPVPAPLPGWIDSAVEPVPRSLAEGLLRAMATLEEHSAAALALLPQTAADPLWQPQIRSFRRSCTSAQARGRLALDLHRTGSREVDPKMLAHVRAAIELHYELGQRVTWHPALAPPEP